MDTFELLDAKNLAEAFVKAREKLHYTGFLNIEIISKQNPHYKEGQVIVRFNIPGNNSQTIYVQF